MTSLPQSDSAVKLTSNEFAVLADFARFIDYGGWKRSEFISSTTYAPSRDSQGRAIRSTLGRLHNKGVLEAEEPDLARYRVSAAGRAVLSARLSDGEEAGR